MLTTQLAIGFLTGLLLGVAVFSTPFSRAVVAGMIAGIVIGGIMIDGVEGYLHWVTYLPLQMAKFYAFWAGLSVGLFGGARLWLRRVP
jgi:hypothetical protein